VVENVVTELLSEEDESRGLLSDGQLGSRKGRSAIDAAAIIVGRAHAVWTNGHITGVLLMDTKPAFPHLGKGRLVNLMKDRQMDGELIRWMESFLSETTVAMIIEGNAMERHPVAAGLTCVTNPLSHLHLRTDKLGRRVSISSQRVILCGQPSLGGDLT